MGKLLIEDTRTGKKYTLPIQGNAIEAREFEQVRCQDLLEGQTGSAKGGITIVAPGLRNTAVVKSSITKLNAQRGTIHFRGHDIKELFESYSFEDVAYLLVWGRLPDAEERENFRSSLVNLMEPPPEVRKTVSAFRVDAPDFTIAQAAMSAWNAVGKQHIPTAQGANIYSSQNPTAVDEGAMRVFAVNAACRALASCHTQGIEFNWPVSAESIAYNILLMYGCVDTGTKKPKETMVRLLDKVMILYADHEMTNSTAAFLHVGSTLADPISCLLAASSAENGPLHGGAIPMALRQFQDIGSKDNVADFLRRVRNKEVLLFGFGHRIWKSVDPRYSLIQRIVDDAELREAFRKTPALSIAMELERQALTDEYFVKNRISPNVDLVGCLVFIALGFPSRSVLGVASIARTAGVAAHWREQLQSSANIWRPQALYEEPTSKQGARISAKTNERLRARL